MEILNIVNYLHHEQKGLKQKYETLLNVVCQIIEALNKEEFKLLNKSRSQPPRRCKFFNRGFCKEGSACPFLHPLENCQEYCTSGSCLEGKKCIKRHPYKCKY